MCIDVILSQYRYKKEAPTNLPNSNEPAIMITAVVAPANNFDNPNTEKKAALPAINNADNHTSVGKCLLFSNIFKPAVFYLYLKILINLLFHLLLE